MKESFPLYLFCTLCLCFVSFFSQSQSQWNTGSDNYSTGRLSLGTSSFSEKLAIEGAGLWHVRIKDNVGGQNWWIGSSGSDWGVGGGKFLITNDALSINSAFAIDPMRQVGIGTTFPRGKFDVDGPGDIFLSDDLNTGTSQSVYFPGHIYLSPYNGTNVSYLQARRYNNSGSTSLRLRTYNNGSLTEAMHIESNGSVGVGTINPDGLQINMSLNYESTSGANNIRMGVLGGTPRIILDNAGFNTFEIDNNGGRFRIFTPGEERFTILSNGNVGIGTVSPGTFRLAVEGKIGAREVNVTNSSQWPDYVFHDTYRLVPLSEIERFVKAFKHLPEVPSAKEIESHGMNLGQINIILLKKIEELTLHMIEKEKQMQTLENRIKQIEAQ